MSFSNQTTKNKVYFEKIIVSTTKVDHSSPTYSRSKKIDPQFRKLIIKSEIVYPVKTQGFEYPILFRDTMRPNKGVPLGRLFKQ